jgi:hypothetical protein
MGAGFALSILALAWQPKVLALPIDIRVEFDAPSDCSEVLTFYDRVRARTDRVRLAEASAQALTLRVRVVRRGGKVHGQLRMTDDHGASSTREVDGASCAEVVDALSLTATLALDPTASPEAPLATVPPPAEVVTLVATPTHPPPPPPPSTLGLEMGAEAGVAEVISPYLSVGGTVFGRLTQGPGERVSRSLGFALGHFGNDIVTSQDEVSARLTTLTLTACPARFDANGAFSLEPCGLFAGGILAVSSRGISNPDSALRSWWSAGLLLRVGVPLGGPAALELEAGGAVPLLKRRFILEIPDRVLGESPAISGFLSLGAAYRF